MKPNSGGSDAAEVVAYATPVLNVPPPAQRPAPGDAESGVKMAAELEYESVLCVKPDVSVYRIPPRASNRGYRYQL